MINLSTLKELFIDGIKLVELYINGVLVWKSGPKNWVPYSTESDGKTIYNGGLGYKNGYRIRSGGAEGSESTASHTGYIPVKGGDDVYFSGWDFSANKTANAINVSNSSFTNIGQITPSYSDAGYGIFAPGAAYQSYCYNSVVRVSDNVWKWKVPPVASGVTYIRVSGYTTPDFSGGDGSKMIVTINEEIT